MKITLSLCCCCCCCCYCFVVCRDFVLHMTTLCRQSNGEWDTAGKVRRRTKTHRQTDERTGWHTNRQRLMAKVTHVTSASIYITHILCAARVCVHCCTIYLQYILVWSAHKAPSLIKSRYKLLGVHSTKINRYTFSLCLYSVIVVVATIFILHSALEPPIHLFGRQSLCIQSVGPSRAATRAAGERQRKWMSAVAVRVTQKCNLNRKSM